MNITQSFKLALKSLRTSKMRALLTMLGIIIGVGAVIVIISLGNGLTGMVEQRVEKLGVTQIMAYTWGLGDGTTENVTPQEMYDLVERCPEVFNGITPWVSSGTGVRQGSTEFKKTSIIGVSEAMYRQDTGTTLDGDTLAKGRYLQYVDVWQRKNVCVIGAYLEQETFHGNALGQQLTIGGVPYTVVGVLAQQGSTLREGGGDDIVYIPYENAMQLSGVSVVTLYQLTAVSRDAVAQGKEILQDYFASVFPEDSEYDAYLVQSMLDQVDEINSMMGIAMAVLVTIAAISLLVGGIGIMNIMLVSVTERTREIVIRKSLGAKRRDIRRQFIIEAGTTSAIGGLLGILFGCLLATGIGSLFGSMLVSSLQAGDLSFRATPTLSAVLVSFGVSVGIGMLFGYLPANKAAKLNPIDALRYD